jgi:glucose-6-phosphate isomerase
MSFLSKVGSAALYVGKSVLELIKEGAEKADNKMITVLW